MDYVLTESGFRKERSACLGNHVCRWQNFVILISLVSLSPLVGEIIIHSRHESHRLVVDLLVTYGEKEPERSPEDGLDILVAAAAAGGVDECYKIISQTKVTHFRNESDSRQNLQTDRQSRGQGRKEGGTNRHLVHG